MLRQLFAWLHKFRKASRLSVRAEFQPEPILNILVAHGIHAVLVGESLMCAENPGQALKALLTPTRKNKQ